MFHQFITPMTTKLSFTNASDLQGSPVSTISFYSNTPSTNENSSCNAQKTFPISDSWKPQIYFDYQTPSNPNVERTSLTLGHVQDTFRLIDNPVPSPYAPEYISTSYNVPQATSIKSPEYCPKTPVYVSNSHDISQKFTNESPIFYPSSPNTSTSKDHDFSIDSPESLPKVFDTFHQVSNDSSESYNNLSSPINISSVNELKRSTLSEKKGNSIEQITSIEKIKFNKIRNDDEQEQENKENSVRDPFKLNSNTSNSVEESTSTYLQSVNSDSDITTDSNQTPTIDQQPSPSDSSNDRLSYWKKGLVRRSTRLAAKPSLNYRV